MMAKRSQFGLVLHSYPNPSAYYLTKSIANDRVSPVIVLISSTASAFLPVLSFGRPIGGANEQRETPATIFGGLLSTYHAFVVSIMFAFSFAFSALFLYSKPQLARALRLSAIMFLCCSLALLVHGIFFNRLSN